MPAQLSIIFVNWNSAEYLRQCIASICEHTRTGEPELIVVDNNSTDRDVDLLCKQFKDLKIIKSPVNVGFGCANNLGFRHSTGTYLLFLNPDTKLMNPAIDIMLKHTEELKNMGVLGCRLLNSDLSVQSSCIQTFPTILNQALDTDLLRARWPDSRLWGTAPLSSDSAALASVEVISGACMMVRREVFERIGLFSEDYFMYAEDLDLCRKAVRAGYTNYYTGDATIIHYGGGSSSPHTATAAKWRSIVQYFVKNRGYSYALLFRCVMSMVALLRLGLIALGMFGRSSAENTGSGYSTSRKWRTILRTLLTSSGRKQAPSHS